MLCSLLAQGVGKRQKSSGSKEGWVLTNRWMICLAGAVLMLNGCAKTDEARRMLDECDTMLTKKTPAHVTNELAEARLALAEQLWQARMRSCGPSTSEQEHALRLIMTKLAHS